MKAKISCLDFVICVMVCVSLIGTASASVFNMGPGLTSLETVTVGNPGNAPDVWGAGYGAVDYTYNIGKYPVTAAQYTVFLNAVAATDTYGLYNTEMAYGYYGWGCLILRHGTSGSYTYTVAAEYANRPVNYVSWGDAARFANWLHNGQPNGSQGAGTTETGAYTLNGAMTSAGLMAVTRNADWKWAITSEDEWYKAAYHKNDGVTGNYWLYPTSSDTINTSMANYDWSVGHNTDVGLYPYPSPYGTFDQGGNVWEWNEAVISSYRGVRGGSLGTNVSLLPASYRSYCYPTLEHYRYGFDIGFRVSEVPEPGTMALLALGGLALLRRRRPV